MPARRENSIFLNVQLGEAAKRNVGTGHNQIPDMSSFQSGTGWQMLPGGLIIQSCIVSIPLGSWSGGSNGWSQSQTVEVALPVPFPNALIGASAALINGGTAWEWVQTYHINFAQKGLSLTGHAPANNIPNQTVQYSVIVLGR
ncbi:gp53-like domain-containing protein [Citrobacter freundii]|uniref:gp53-like domain-containing protein n=1 Tax=Citrobacter freundii TaxID=546 RepID=UPI003EDA3463